MNVSANKSDYATRLLRKLIQIPSFTGKEQEISEFVLSEMKSIGLSVRTYDSGNNRLNVVGIYKGDGKGKSLMLNGHMDTQAIVDNWTLDPLAGEVQDGKIFGVGSADQKAGVAAMIAAAKSITDESRTFSGDLIIAAVVGHMEGGRGTRTLISNKVLADYAIVTEPSQMNLMVEGGGIVYLDIETTGRSVFTPERSKGVSAILKMMKVIRAIEKLHFKYKKSQYIKRPYVNVG